MNTTFSVLFFLLCTAPVSMLKEDRIRNCVHQQRVGHHGRWIHKGNVKCWAALANGSGCCCCSFKPTTKHRSISLASSSCFSSCSCAPLRVLLLDVGGQCQRHSDYVSSHHVLLDAAAMVTASFYLLSLSLVDQMNPITNYYFFLLIVFFFLNLV